MSGSTRLFNRKWAFLKEALQRGPRFWWHELTWRLAGKGIGRWRYVPSVPRLLDIELSYACNLACVMCPQSVDLNVKGAMKPELAEKLVREAADLGVYSIKWNFRGEATLNKHIVRLTRLAKDLGIGNIQMNTNGNMRACTVEDLCEAGIDRLIFSVDGATKETYESIRIGGDFDELCETIQRAVDWRERNKSKKPYIRVQMCKQSKNAHEVETFIKTWKGIVDDIRVSQVTDRGTDGFLHIGDLVAYDRTVCQQPFQRLTIGYDGTVMGCCSDWYQNAPVGDAKTQSVKYIWKNSNKLYQMREAQIEGYQDAIGPCKTCWARDGYKWKEADRLPEENPELLNEFMQGKDRHTHGNSAQRTYS